MVIFNELMARLVGRFGAKGPRWYAWAWARIAAP